MIGNYMVMVGSTAFIPLMRVYHLDKSREFQCVATKIGTPFNKEDLEKVPGFGKDEIGMIEGMIHMRGIEEILIEPKKLIIHRNSWCEWEDIERRVKELIQNVLGQNGDFILNECAVFAPMEYPVE